MSSSGKGRLASIISRADVRRNTPPRAGVPWVPLYQGNGRFGSCYGPWGLHVAGSPPYPIHGKTQFMHLQHYARAAFGADYLLPLAKIHWEIEPEGVSEYRQEQSFYDGTVTTFFDAGEYAAEVVSWFDPVGRNMAGFLFDVGGERPAVVVEPFREVDVHYDQHLDADFRASVQGNRWQAKMKCLNASANFSVRSNADLEAFEDGVKLRLPEGRSWVLVAVNGEPDVGAEEHTIPGLVRALAASYTV